MVCLLSMGRKVRGVAIGVWEDEEVVVPFPEEGTSPVGLGADWILEEAATDHAKWGAV